MESHEILNGKARLYQRPDSDLWYASIYCLKSPQVWRRNIAPIV